MTQALSETIILKSPTGATWTVGLSARGDTLFLEKGWNEFIADNSLVEDDVLLFKYNRGSHFESQMFDDQSSCEKEASYFDGKCDHLELENVGGALGNCTSLCTGVAFSANKAKAAHGRNIQLVRRGCHLQQEANSNLADRYKSQLLVCVLSHFDISLVHEGNLDFCESLAFFEMMLTVHAYDISGTQEMGRMILGYPILYESRRRPLTEVKKRNADLANAALESTKGSCIMVMRSSHVYKGFYLSIAIEWAANHLPGVSHVVLCVPNDTRRWTTKYHNKGSGCGLIGGWKKFCS